MSIEGSCYCGSVTYSINPKTKSISLYCHCESCRRSHSCALYQVSYIPKNNVTILSGEDNVKLAIKKPMNLAEGTNTVKRFFCEMCGSRLWNQLELPQQAAEKYGVEEGTFYGIFPGALNSIPDEFTPTMHVWCSESILDLSSLSDSLPKHSHFPSMPENTLL